ncbi:MAG TPA: Vms1/Ankzf1 family peptidyl-tRNA hydrolase [Acidimicrobiia bacterium]|nr:Vms1/Ankzf1 family peptidyl-tRNA hydrolase [Acidimicrobiia bacterium]
MQHRGVTPTGGVNVDNLRELGSADTSSVTVLLSTDPAEANPGPRWEQRWKTARRELEGRGADAGALEQLDDAAIDAYRRGDVFYAVADPTRLWLSETWTGEVRAEILRVSALPSLAPLLAHRQREVPHVVALVDRQGADVVAVEREGEVHDGQVAGEGGAVIRKSGPGGWSQRRYQDRAEESWARTAESIAETLTSTVDRIDAQLIVLAGDVREVQLVRQALPDRLGERVHVIDGGRAAGTDEAARDHEIKRLLETAVADATVGMLRKLREELAQHDRGVVGTAPTLDALRKAQVDVLLVHDDLDDGRTAWFGVAPTTIGVTEDEARDIEPDDAGREPREGRLADVAIRAAIGTGADVRIVPSVHALPDGLGAILRWSDGA